MRDIINSFLTLPERVNRKRRGVLIREDLHGVEDAVRDLERREDVLELDAWVVAFHHTRVEFEDEDDEFDRGRAVRDPTHPSSHYRGIMHWTDASGSHSYVTQEHETWEAAAADMGAYAHRYMEGEV